MSIRHSDDPNSDGATPHRGDLRLSIAHRLREVRKSVFGELGVPEVAMVMGVTAFDWLSFEAGTSIPSEVILKFIEETGVTPFWLLTGQGDMFRRSR